MVEIEEAEKIVIAKPIACRPGFSNLKSFSELLTCGADNASPPVAAVISETAVAAIRPRTVRLNPVPNRDLLGGGSAASFPSNLVPESNVVKSNVVYKPVAKLVSKATVSLLANLGSYGISPTREISETVSRIQPPNQVEHQTDLKSDFHENFPPQSERNRNNVDQPCYDGHNWRKYGQKQVKGSENPRSYYKCTHQNCPVKKKVEKTLDGKIAEIVYNGEHNHSKPQPYDATRNHLLANQNDNINLSAAQSNSSSAAPPTNDPITAVTCNTSVSTSNNSLGVSGECEEVSEPLEAKGGDFKSKRRKSASTSKESSFEPRNVVRNNTDSEIVGDGFRWRKYGQKVVKGNPYPRSYYRCTSPKCNVRKYVERTSEEDPGTFITTYEGKHNHDMPTKTNKY